MKYLLPALMLLALAACGSDTHPVQPILNSYQADDGNVYPCPNPAACPDPGSPAPTDGQ
jgi:uncharacterized lipoprotein